MSVLREWRRDRRDTGYWKKARERSGSMREAEIVSEIDLALMGGGLIITRYRSSDRKTQLDQLKELRLSLEACLGMLENVLPE
jgi:hypothetical protein